MEDTTVSCQHCGKKFNALFAKCPFCGAKNDVSNLNDKKEAICPRCKLPLHHACIRESEVAICSDCRGMWFDTDVFKYLVSKKDVYKDDSLPRSFDKKPLSRTDENRMYVPCPKCGTVMNRKNFKRISGIIIDICPKHGVWLDHGELEQIRAFVANVDMEELLALDIKLNEEEIHSSENKLK